MCYSGAVATMVTLPISCNKDCGAGCPLLAHVRDGRLHRVSDNPLGDPAGRGCARGYGMPRMLYAPDRITRPLIRVGPRGGGAFREASWREALSRVASGLAEIRRRHGPQAVMRLGGSGSCRGALHNTAALTRRFLSLFGGYTEIEGNFSAAAEGFVRPFLFGSAPVGLDPATLRRSRLIVLWGANVSDTRFGASLEHHLRACRRDGVPVYVVDPRRSRTVRRLDAEWVPVLPGTDAALMVAVLHVLIAAGLVDRQAVRRLSVGFEELERRVLGADGGPPRDPEWASRLCGTPADQIRRLALAYGRARPAALLPGLSIQRVLGGEEAYRFAAALQVATGNVGRPGGSSGGCIWGRLPRPRCGALAAAAEGLPGVPVYRWADAVLEGRAGGYPTDVHALYCVGGNYIGQGADVKRSIRAFGKVELAVCHEHFLTPTARWCDVVLPVAMFAEREDIVFPDSNHLLFSHRAVEPPRRVPDDYALFARLAERLGFAGEFTEGRSPEEWLRLFASQSEITDWEEFRRTGIYAGAEQSRVGLAAFAADPDGNPLSTPSGKIELRSEAYARTGFSALPQCRLPEPEPGYPLRLVSPHARYRINSQYWNDRAARRRGPQVLWMHPRDAAARGVEGGRTVTVRSPHGAVRVGVRITPEIMPGVVCLPAGAWPEVDEEGVDRAGCPNLLTSTTPTLPSGGARTHTVWVEVSAQD